MISKANLLAKLHVNYLCETMKSTEAEMIKEMKSERSTHIMMHAWIHNILRDSLLSVSQEYTGSCSGYEIT